MAQNRRIGENTKHQKERSYLIAFRPNGIIGQNKFLIEMLTKTGLESTKRYFELLVLEFDFLYNRNSFLFIGITTTMLGITTTTLHSIRSKIYSQQFNFLLPYKLKYVYQSRIKYDKHPICSKNVRATSIQPMKKIKWSHSMRTSSN